jgi:hypothetical protein
LRSTASAASKACRLYQPSGDIVGTRRLAIAQRFSAPRRQLVAREILGAPSVGALRLDVPGIAVGLEQPQNAVDVRQVGAVLLQLTFELLK